MQITIDNEMKTQFEMDSENARTVAAKLVILADLADGIAPPLKAKGIAP